MADTFKMRLGGAESTSSQADLVRALTGSDAQEGRAILRTRRIVHGTVIGMEEQRVSRRKKTGLVLLASLLFLTLLAPALWSSVDSFAAGNHFADLQTQTYLLGVMIFPGIVAAAIAGFTRHRSQGRRQT